MTTPKKPPSKTESAIQLGNMLKYAGKGGGTAKGLLNKVRRELRKIGTYRKPKTKTLTLDKSASGSNKILEAGTTKKSVQSQTGKFAKGKSKKSWTYPKRQKAK